MLVPEQSRRDSEGSLEKEQEIKMKVTFEPGLERQVADCSVLGEMEAIRIKSQLPGGSLRGHTGV